MKLGWIYDRRFLLHETSFTHVERLEVIAATVEKAGLTKLVADGISIPSGGG